MRKFLAGVSTVIIIPLTGALLVVQTAVSYWLNPMIYQESLRQTNAYERTTAALNDLIATEYSIGQELLTAIWLEQQVNPLLNDILVVVTTPQYTLQNWSATISLREPKQVLTTVLAQTTAAGPLDELVSLNQLPDELALNQLIVANVTQADPFSLTADHFAAPAVQQFEQQLSGVQQSVNLLHSILLFGWIGLAILIGIVLVVWPGGRGKSRALGIGLTLPSSAVCLVGIILYIGPHVLLGLSPLVLIPDPWQNIVTDIVTLLLKKFGWTLALSSLPLLAAGLFSIILSLLLRHHEKTLLK